MSYQLTPFAYSPPDGRDFLYVAPDGPVPASVDLYDKLFDIKDQGREGSCVANAVASGCELHWKRGGQASDLSRNFLYKNARDAENYGGEGIINCRDALKSANKQGLCLESLWPYTDATWNATPSAEAYADGLTRKLDRYELIQRRGDYYGVTDALKAVKSSLAEGCPVFVAMSVGSAIFGLTGPWREQNYVMNDFVGGHGMLIVGYDDAVQKFHVLNSWGSDYGDRGTLGMSYFWLGIMELWSLRGFAGQDVLPAPGIRLAWKSPTELTVRIVPQPVDIGATRNVWIGAMLGDKLFLKTSLETDAWQEWDGVNYPACGQIALEDDNDVAVVSNMDLTPYVGATVYVAYGNTPLDWTVQKVCMV